MWFKKLHNMQLINERYTNFQQIHSQSSMVNRGYYTKCSVTLILNFSVVMSRLATW